MNNFKNAVNCTAFAMILLTLLFYLAAFVVAWFGGTAYYIADLLFYAAAFIIPYIFLKISLKKFNIPLGWESGSCSIDPGTAIFAAFAGVAAVNVMGNTSNTYFSLFDLFGVYISDYLPDITEETVLQSLLYLVSAAVVPAIVEELLFRGAILKLYLPYSKTFAIFISSILFAFMHGTADQLLYTFVFGLLLGYVTAMTSTIRYAVLSHFMNNIISVIMWYVYVYMPYEFYSAFSIGIDVFTIAVGAIGFIMLIKSMPRASEFDEKNASCGKLIAQAFKNPVMIIFFIISISEIVTDLVYRLI